MRFYAGDLRCCGFNFAPQGWLPCDGRMLSTSEYPELSKAVGNAFGGDGANSFCVPISSPGHPCMQVKTRRADSTPVGRWMA